MEGMGDIIKISQISAADFKRNLTIDIDHQLAYDSKHGREKKPVQILEAIARNEPFMLYKDTIRFCVVIPKFKSIVTIFPGRQSTVEVMNEHQFQNRVKMCYVFYPSFGKPSAELTISTLQMIAQHMDPLLKPDTKPEPIIKLID